MVAADELTHGTLEAAERYLDPAERGPAGRSDHVRLPLGIVRMQLARQRGDLPQVAEEARRLQAMTQVPHAARPGFGEEVRALALISLGVAQFWAAGPDEAERHLEQGRVLARRIGRPYLEFTGLAYQAATKLYRSFAGSATYSMQAIELAERHGWTDDPATGIAFWCTERHRPGRGGRRRPSPGSSAPNVCSEPKPSPRPHWARGTHAAWSNWAAAATPTRRPLSRPPNGWANAARYRTTSGWRRRHCTCTPWCASVRPERAEQALAALSDQDRDGVVDAH